MSLQTELSKVVKKKSETEFTSLYEGTVMSKGRNGSYKVRLKNGAVVTKISGPTDLQINDPVIMATHSGQKKGFVIISKGCRKAGIIKEIRVS